MDEAKNKPHQERLKTDIELKVTDDAEPTDDREQTHDVELPNAPDGSAQAGKASDSRDLRVTVLAERKAREQAFLSEYKRKLVRTRIKFVAYAAIFIAIFGTLVYFVCSKNAKAAAALTQFQAIPVFAELGERDMAYYTMSNFTHDTTSTVVEPKLLEERVRILNRSIAEQERAGQPAIFTRLGAEQMLVRQGKRDQAFKFGDPLIAKYPDLPSNWFWRAKIDFDHLDFANAVKDYDVTADMVERMPSNVGESFHEEYIKAVWAAINAGQFEEAKRFSLLSGKYGLDTYDTQALQSQILLSESSALATSKLKKTDLWNEELDRYNQRLLNEAKKLASSMDFTRYYRSTNIVTDISKHDLLFETTLHSGQFIQAEDIIADTYSQSHRSRRQAALLLAQNQPQKALDELTPWRKRTTYRGKNLEILAAEAQVKLHRPAEALEIVNDMLLTYHSPDGVSTGKLYLPFRIIKAQALFDSGKYQEAIEECDAITAINPNLIEPRLIKTDALRKLGQTDLAKKEHEATSAQLTKILEEKSSKRQ